MRIVILWLNLVVSILVAQSFLIKADKENKQNKMDLQAHFLAYMT